MLVRCLTCGNRYSVCNPEPLKYRDGSLCLVAGQHDHCPKCSSYAAEEDNMVNPKYRSLMALVLASSAEARRMYKLLGNLGARNMRPDTMFGTISPDMWYADCRGGLFVCMMRDPNDGSWSLHS